MPYKEEIAKYIREASLVSANEQMSLELINKCYHESGVILICHDGKCIELEMEEE